MLFRRPDGSIKKWWVWCVLLGAPAMATTLVMELLVAAPTAGPWILAAIVIFGIAAAVAARLLR